MPKGGGHGSACDVSVESMCLSAFVCVSSSCSCRQGEMYDGTSCVTGVEDVLKTNLIK